MQRKDFMGVIGAMLVLTSAASGVELKLKWEEGKRYTFVDETSSAMTVELGGGKMSTKSEMTQEMHYDVAAHEKGVEVKLSIDSMKMAMTVNGQQMMAFDSADENGGGELAKTIKPLLEMKASVIYDKEGNALEVTGLDGLEGMQQIGFGKEEMEQMVKQASLLLPGKEVELGETWKAELNLPLGQLSKEPATMVFELKYEGMEKKDGHDLAKISLGGAMKMAVEGEGAPAIVLESKKVSGTMFFDPVLGQPRETTMQMELEMGLPKGVPVQEGAPGKMPLSILSKQKLKSVVQAK